MTDETIARQKARGYDTEYSEDFTMSDMLSRPQDFNRQSIKDVYLCLKEKHYRDGYIDGLTEGRKEKCLEQNSDGTIHQEINELKKHRDKLLKKSIIDFQKIDELEKENAELKKALSNNPETASVTQLMELIQVREENEKLKAEIENDELALNESKEIIAELKAHCKAVDENRELKGQIKSMRKC